MDRGAQYLNCAPCYAYCLECKEPNNNVSCTSCNQLSVDYFLFQEKEVDSAEGYCTDACESHYFQNASLMCQPCSALCLECGAAADSACTLCDPALALQPNTLNNSVGQCLGACSAGYAILDSGAQNKLCQMCHESCATCEVPGVDTKCLSCRSTLDAEKYLQEVITGSFLGRCQSSCEPYYYANGSFVCLRCSDHCYSCETLGADKCTSCLKSDAPNSHLQPIFGSNAATGYCQSACEPHYNLTDAAAAQLACQLCDATCGRCTQPGVATACTSCNFTNTDHFYLQEIAVNSSTGRCQDACSAHYFADTTTHPDYYVCTLCHYRCQNCSGPGEDQCYNCSDPADTLQPVAPHALTGRCQHQCDVRFAILNAGETYQLCDVCNESCLTCQQPFVNSSCLTCDTGDADHLNFQASSDGSSTGFCLKLCFADYQPFDFICSKCDSQTHCLACKSQFDNSSCLSCDTAAGASHPYLTITDAGEGTGYCLEECWDGYAAAENSYVCTPCHSTCLTCALPGDQFACVSCNASAATHQYFQESTAGSQTGQCVNACNTSYFRNASEFVCRNCSTTCYSCESSESNRCTNCKIALTDHAALQPNEGQTDIGTCQAACDAGFALPLADSPLFLVCAPCHGECASCVYPANDTSCLTCDGSAGSVTSHLQEVANQSYVGKCQSACEAHYLQDATNTSAFAVCKRCYDTCGNCSAFTYDGCTSCNKADAQHRVLQPNAGNDLVGTCLDQCSSNYALQDDAADSLVCLQCDGACQTCTRPGNSTACKSCFTGTAATYFYQENYATAPDGSCTAECTAHYFADAASADPQLCRACFAGCDNCTANSPLNCTTCNDSVLFQPSDWSAAVGTCQLACNGGYAVLNPDDTSGRVCAPCHSSCLTCSAPGSAANCTSCNTASLDHKHFQEKVVGDGFGFCQNACNVSFYAETSDYICHPCSASCFTCDHFGDAFCTGCSQANAGHAVLQPTTANVAIGFCQEECDAHYTLRDEAEAYLVCQLCSATCGNCTVAGSASNCTTCDLAANSDKGYFQELGYNSGVGQCQDECLSHYYVVFVSAHNYYACTICDASCHNCTGPGTAACSNCSSAAKTLQPSSDALPSIGECLSQCHQGYAILNKGDTYQMCRKCSSTCLSCLSPDNETRCQSCNPAQLSYRYLQIVNYTELTGVCQQLCNDTYIPVNNVCTQCLEATHCLTCL